MDCRVTKCQWNEVYSILTRTISVAKLATLLPLIRKIKYLEYWYGVRICRDLSLVMCFIPHFSNLIPFTHAQCNEKIIYILLWISGLIFLLYGNCNRDLWVFQNLRKYGEFAVPDSCHQPFAVGSTVKFQCTFVWNDLSVHAKGKNIPAPSLNVLRKYLHFIAVRWTQPCAFWLTADWNNRECCTGCFL